MDFSRSIFWHRRDLRMEDNLGLSATLEQSKALTGVYIFDPKIFNSEKISAAKTWFIIESLRELQLNWKDSGSELLILEGEPLKILPDLCNSINATIVNWNKDVDPYIIKQDKQISSVLRNLNISTRQYWDHLIIEPGALKTKTKTPYKVYTPFYLSWKNEFSKKFIDGIKISSKPRDLIKINKNNLNQKNIYFWKKLNFIEDINRLKLNFNGIIYCPCKPGEHHSKIQLNEFIETSLLEKEKASIYFYERNRDYPSISGTSKLSAALSTGTISPRVIIKELINSYLFALSNKNDEAIRSINVWEKEIVWREFYNHSLFTFPELEKSPFKKKWANFPWRNNSNELDKWANGLTGFPIVDAAMRQLNTSGWMHNRCRMIVASFLVKDLVCDWRLGESDFIKKLVDGDIASNNGGWQWSASSGMDSKPLRIFNPYTQTKKYDPKAIYIKKWLPELSHINDYDLVTGNILPIERRGYPPPIVNHKLQQALFKELYAKL